MKLNNQLNKSKDNKNLETYHVSSKLKSIERLQEMKMFERTEYGLMTNARCLTEGIDVPSIDCVIFVDPKKSKIDIVQAAGRAMRLNKNKKFGYILIPIISNEKNLKESSSGSKYEDLVSIITTLSSHDERLIDEIKFLTQKQNLKHRYKNIINLKLNKLTKINIKNLEKSISLKVWNRIKNISFVDFEKAKNFALSLNLNSRKEWSEFVKSEKMPIDIPHSPHWIYKNYGWKSYGDFLGTNRIATFNREYLSFSKAKKYVHTLKLKTVNDWKEFTRNKKFPSNLPSTPTNVYKNLGWISYPDFLGTSTVANQFKKFVNYAELKQFVYNKFKSKDDWLNFVKSNNFPSKFPSSPPHQYKNEWVSWPDFLGYKKPRYEEAKKIIHKYKFNKAEEFIKFIKKHPELNIPVAADKSYQRSKEWVSWADFLGNDNVSSHLRKYVSYKNAKKFAKKKKIYTIVEWHKQKNNFPKNIPRNPFIVYKNKGWINWVDFLEGQKLYF